MNKPDDDDNKYINPITKVYSSYNEAKEHYGKDTYEILFKDQIPLPVSDLIQGKRSLIVGEPGIGKTELLKRIEKELVSVGEKPTLISLRLDDAVARIDAFLKTPGERKTLLLDALDEIPSNVFPSVLKKIEEISTSDKDFGVSIYLSVRWVFLHKYANSFRGYRVITISPFTDTQIKEYLVTAVQSEEQVENLITRVMQFNHGKLILQIPRYLFFLKDFLKVNKIDNVENISRNELFEHFIYSKLEDEGQKGNLDKKAIIKRMLEKLALVMEIFQTNTISEDDLVTFFDDLRSDLKFVFLAQFDLEVFTKRYLLQRSRENLERIEFGNTEFQEYLAAKEISRFTEPWRAAFSFAANSDTNELYPSWLNTLTFLVDMDPCLLEPLTEFSGIRSSGFKVIDESFWSFLSRVNSTNIPANYKKRIFLDVLDYQSRTLQWLPTQIISTLPRFFAPELEAELKARVELAESKTGLERYVPLGNLASIIGYLLKSKSRLDQPYWRKKLTTLASDINENGVLQRHALFALEFIADPTIINDLPDLTKSGDALIVRAFISLCTAIAPDHPKSVEYFIKNIKRNKLDGRYGLYAIKEKPSIRKFLEAYISDDGFRKEFLDDNSILGKRDIGLIQRIDAIFDDEVAELCKQAIIKSFDQHFYYGEKVTFVVELMRLLKSKNPLGFIPEILTRIQATPKNSSILYWAQGFLVEIIQLEDVPVYMAKMIAANENDFAMSTMRRIKASKRDCREQIYEAGRESLPEKYAEWETAQTCDPKVAECAQTEALLREFRDHLEPSPKKYSTGLFAYYRQNSEKLNPVLTEANKMRFIDLIVNQILKFDPAEYGHIEEPCEGTGAKRHTHSSVVPYYGDALYAAKQLHIDILPYKKNILRYIPFAIYTEELKLLFDLIPKVEATELAPVLEIYTGKNTHLWKYQPGRIQLRSATPCLKTSAGVL